MAALVGALVELGYGVGYRVLDARHFGVPQRRRRVFILGLTPGGRAGAERAAEVLSVGSRCRRHPPTGIEAGEGAAEGAPCSPDGIVGQALSAKWSKQAGEPAGDEHHNLIRQTPDPDGVRAPDGMAGRPHDRGGVADTLRVGGRASGAGDSYDNTPWVAETYPTLRRGGHGDPGIGRDNDHERLVTGVGAMSDDGLPLGLDSHRYRCCGNGVVSSVAEWIGYRLTEALA